MRRSFFLSVTTCLVLPLCGCFLGQNLDSPVSPKGSASFTANAMVWSEPVNLGPTINSAALDQGPCISSDGLALYFSSSRPGGMGASDIWVARRASPDSPWEAPQNIGPVVNTSAAEGSPGLSRDGLLLFIPSNRPGGLGMNDIYVSRRSDPTDDFGWSAPVSLGSAVNSADFDGTPKFFHLGGQGDHRFVYFTRSQFAMSPGDIYAAPIDHDGLPLEPATLVADLSDPAASDGTPAFSSNGKEAIVPSERAGTLGIFDFFLFTRQNAQDPWSLAQLIPGPLNSSSIEFHPSLSSDGSTLFFAAVRPGGLGNFDIWMSTR